MTDLLVARIPGIKVEQIQKLPAAIRKFFYGVSDGLLFLRLDLNIFDVHIGGGRFLQLVGIGGLAHALRPHMDALSRRRGDQPGADLRFVLKLMEMLDEFQADGLKDIRRISSGEVELNGNGVNETPVANYQRFPGQGVAAQTHRDEFRITESLVFCGAHSAKLPRLPEGMNAKA